MTETCCHVPKKSPWYKSIFIWSLILTGVFLGLSLFIPSFIAFRETFFSYLQMLALPILLGLLIGGMVDYYVPQRYIIKHLAAARRRTVFYAASLGLLMSACSHGIIALAMELHKKGASPSAVISFLLASPWANLPITILLVSLWGWKGLIIIAAAFLVAISTGLIFQILEQKNWVEQNKHTVQIEEDFSVGKDVIERIRRYRFTHANLKSDISGVFRGAIGLSKMMMGWILIGIVLSSLADAFIPQGWFHKFLGPTWLGLLGTLLFAAVLEVCSEGTAPLAFQIYKETGAFGNAFAFLMGGVVTDLTEIGLVWSNLGPRTAFWMVALTLPQVFLLGFLLNHFL